MALWESVSVDVEEITKSEIEKLVEEVDPSEYYLQPWEVDSNSAWIWNTEEIKVGSVNWEDMLSAISKALNGRGHAVIREKCNEDEPFETIYELKDGEISVHSEDESEDYDEDEDFMKDIIRITFSDCHFDSNDFSCIKQEIIKFVQENQYPIHISEEDNIESVFSVLGLGDVVSIGDESIDLEGEVECAAFSYPMIDLLAIFAHYTLTEDIGYAISINNGPVTISSDDDGDLSFEY